MLTISIILQTLLFQFHQATTLFDLYPFNNVRNYTMKERLLECSVNGAMFAVPPVGFLFYVDWMIFASLVIYPVLLIGKYQT